MKKQFLDILRAMSKVDFRKTPNFIVMERLIARLMMKGVPVTYATKAVARMEISVGDEYMEDKAFIDEATELFASAVANLYFACIEDFDTDTFIAQAPKMSFKIN